MKRLIDGFLVAVLVVLSLSSVSATGAYAQEANAAMTPDQRKAQAQERLQELKAKIETLKYAKLKEQLAMDDATAEKFFQIYKPAEKEIQDIVKQRNQELKSLGMMMNGAKSDADVDPEMQKIRELNKQIEDRAFKLSDDLKPVLSPRQRAKLLVFEHEFAKRVNEEVVKRRLQNNDGRMRQLRRELEQRRIMRRKLLKKLGP